MTDQATPSSADQITTDEAASFDLSGSIDALIAAAGITSNRNQIRRILTTAVGLGLDETERLNLKITDAALAEMREAFSIFMPYQEVPKVTIFGSARTKPDDPLYVRTHQLAAALADDGWMVITGAGPGIMQAAMEGAGRARSIGVSIRLPFEEKPNDVIHGDAKHVSMKYFFTRKLMLVKESQAFVCLPGGFGTLDETFETLTLQQTGKAEPTPIVLLDFPGGTYWQGFAAFVEDELVRLGMVAPDDMSRVLVTDSVEAARKEVLGFWRNYDSLRWVGKRLVLRLRSEPTEAEIEQLNDQFGHLLAEGRIERTGALGPEVSGDDKVDLPRLALVLDQFRVGSLHELIRAINALDSAPAEAHTPEPTPDPT